MAYFRELRQSQTVAELDRLRDELASWVCRRKKDDRRSQYSSQLDALANEINEAIASLREGINAPAVGVPTGELFQRLAADDRRIIWVRRAWDYFREKFDQREDQALGPVLRAADEAVWSCYKPFFGGSKLPPAPLCCIDASYVPTAVRPDQAAHQLERTDEINVGPLADCMRRLPIPILRLPPGLVSSPWALAIIGHETGHFIQRMMDNAAGFFDWMSGEIAAAVERAGGGEADRSAWTRCTDEIFADLYFVLTIGPWAVWAIAPWAMGPDPMMLVRQRYYPAPVVRLRLLAAFAEKLGIAEADALCRDVVDLDAASTSSGETQLDLHIAEEVATLVTKELPDGRGALPQRIGFRASDFGSNRIVDNWSKALIGKSDRDDDNDLRTARLVTAAAVKASWDITRLGDENERSMRLAVLRRSAPIRIAGCFEKGVRAAPAPTQRRPGPSLAQLVREATEEMLLR